MKHSFQKFKAAYAAQNYGIACDVFTRSLTLMPDPTYRYFATHASAQLIYSLEKTGLLEKTTRQLSQLFKTNPQIHLMYFGDPNTTDYFFRLRSENIEKMMPSVLLVTQEKSASISISNIFNSGFQLPSYAYSLITQRIVPSWIEDYARGGACYATHLRPHSHVIEAIKKSKIEKILVHVRDPRQTVVSMMHHISRYPDQFIEIQNQGFNNLDDVEKIKILSGMYMETIYWLEGWIKAAKHLPIFFTTFESFKKNTPAFIQSCVDWYAAPESYFNYENATKQHEGTDYHFRKGSANEWQEIMPGALKARFSSMLAPSIKQRFGWAE